MYQCLPGQPGIVSGPAGRDDVQPALGVQDVGEAEQVVLVGAATVVQDEQPGGVCGGGTLLEDEGGGHTVVMVTVSGVFEHGGCARNYSG